MNFEKQAEGALDQVKNLTLENEGLRATVTAQARIIGALKKNLVPKAEQVKTQELIDALKKQVRYWTDEVAKSKDELLKLKRRIADAVKT